MADPLQRYTEELTALAREQGLDFHPVDFEVVPPSFMMEVAVYGLPVRMAHWSFGVRWIHQLVQHRMGHSRIFEVVFPGNPNRAYLVNTNSLQENTLVVAHVLGHSDFARNNLLFQRVEREVGHHIVEQAAAHAHRIQEAIDEFGQERVERVLDAALALEQHVDLQRPLNRGRYAAPPAVDTTEPAESFRSRFGALPGERDAALPTRARTRLRIPPHPETDLLWFIAEYAPEMEDWERDIFLAVREESFYFYPVFSCQIMNEGWASYWHARLLREAGFLPQSLYVDAMKTHSDVVRPHAGEHQVALAINPYHLGFVLWDSIVEGQGLDAARAVMSAEDDFGFVRNHLTAELAERLNLFVYQARSDGEIKVLERDIAALHEAILAPKYNFSAPHLAVAELRVDGGLVLEHDYRIDGRGLDLARAHKVLNYIRQVWRRPVSLLTQDALGGEQVLEASERRT